MIFAGPMAGAVKSARIARAMRYTGAALEGVGAGVRTYDAYQAWQNDDKIAAAGYLGEAALRMLGMKKHAIAALKTKVPRSVPGTLGGLQARIDTYARRAELRAWEKGLSGTRAGKYADRYLSKATYQLNRRLEQSGSKYRVLSEYGRDVFGQEFFGNSRPANTRFLDVCTNKHRPYHCVLWMGCSLPKYTLSELEHKQDKQRLCAFLRHSRGVCSRNWCRGSSPVT